MRSASLKLLCKLTAHSADVDVTTDTPPISVLHASCLRLWLAVRTVSLDLTVSSRRYNIAQQLSSQRFYLP